MSNRIARVGAVLFGLAAGLWACGGCASEPRFPSPVDLRSEATETVFVYDTNGDKRADFWQYQRADGRKSAVAYADEAGEPGPRIELNEIDAVECPHLLIALDGVPFEIVEQMHAQGHFRFFSPPSRMICCFPGMTDVALSELFHAGPCHSLQAQSFDRERNRLSDANTEYLSASNSPWVEQMAYRCSFWWDVLVYLDPQAVFDHELKRLAQTFRAVEEGEAYGYSVGTAGLGTREGRAGIIAYLRAVDRLCEQIIFERRGRVKLTLTADHGHNLAVNRRISFDDTLKAGGYRKTKSLRTPRDVVSISYGLVTYAEFFTQDPAGVADCLLGHEDVELALYPSGDAIVVCDRDGRARITRGAAGFVYDASEGDPLRLDAIIDRLRADGMVSAESEIDGAAMFEATLAHDYPTRWRGFGRRFMNWWRIRRT